MVSELMSPQTRSPRLLNALPIGEVLWPSMNLPPQVMKYTNLLVSTVDTLREEPVTMSQPQQGALLVDDLIGHSQLLSVTESATLGRQGDILLAADDPAMHRTFLQVWSNGAQWFLKNIGSFVAATIQPPASCGYGRTVLSPGSIEVLHPGTSTLYFSTATMSYECELTVMQPLRSPEPSLHRMAHSQPTSLNPTRSSASYSRLWPSLSSMIPLPNHAWLWEPSASSPKPWSGRKRRLSARFKLWRKLCRSSACLNFSRGRRFRGASFWRSSPRPTPNTMHTFHNNSVIIS